MGRERFASMLEDRNLQLDLLALALLALTIFLATSLVTYHPGDPPSKLVFPEPTETLNACGQSGAMVSRWLFESLGLGAYYVLLSLATLDVLLLTRKPLDQPVLRTTGWLMSLVGVCTVAAIAVPRFSPGPVVGAGGYLGAAGRGLLEMHFATVGAYILITSWILAGLLLCTDYLVLRLVAWSFGRTTSGLLRGMLHAATAYSHRLGGPTKSTKAAKPQEAEEEVEWVYEYEEEPGAEEETEEEADVAVRIGGRQNGEEADDAEADDDDTADQTGEKRKSLTSMLRIRKPTKSAREQVIEQLKAAGDTVSEDVADYELPSIDLLMPSEEFSFEEQEKEVRRRAKILEKTFTSFNLNVRVVEIQTGPVIAQFEVELEAGLRLSKITGLADDLAIALRVPSVRIVAPIPGKNTVGIEVPNTERQLVRMREVMEEANGKAAKMRIPLYLGKDVAGNPMVVDLSTLPHLLIAGRTGTGKSVCLNSLIVSMLMTRRPDEVRLLLIDPKMVELSPYKQLPHLMHPVVTDMRKAEAILAWAVDKMEERYALLARAGVRHIASYNQLGEEELMERMQPEDDEERKQIPRQLPYVVIVADEMADLMMTSAKEVETHIIRLAQKSRAVGIHLVLATQKPTVDVITGLIKSNLPARIAFQVASRVDSRVVLDEMGADKLLGNGDMLFLWPGTSTLIRGQGTYLGDEEISRVIASVATVEPQFVKELVQLKTGEPEGEAPQLGNRDDLYDSAVEVVIREGRGSVSLLQRALGIGYGRAARLIDYMAEDGVVGPYNGSQAREVMISFEDWQARTEAPADPPPATRRSNRIQIAEPTPEPSPEPAGSMRPAKRKSRKKAEEVEELEEDAFEPIDEEQEYEEEEAPFDTDESEEEWDDEDEEVDDEEWEYEDDEEEEYDEEAVDEEDYEDDEYEYEHDEEDEDEDDEEAEEEDEYEPVVVRRRRRR